MKREVTITLVAASSAFSNTMLAVAAGLEPSSLDYVASVLPLGCTTNKFGSF
jgi:hypothetical protein